MTRTLMAALGLAVATAAAPATTSPPTPPSPARSRPSRGHDRGALPLALGVLPARVGRPCPRRCASWAASRAPRASSSNTAQAHAYFRALAEASPRVQRLPHRQERGGPRDPDGRHRRRGRHPRPRPPEGRDRRPRRSAPHDPRGGREAHRDRAAHLLPERRPPLRRDGQRRAMLELAYRLAVSEQPMIRAIRENVVVLINPVSKPDGRDKVVEWFYRFLKGKTDYDTPAPAVAALLGEVRLRGHQPRHPPEGARDHEGGAPHVPRVPPHGRARPARGHSADAHLERHGPLQPATSTPSPTASSSSSASTRCSALTALGMPGVWTWNFGEAFGHHYLDSVAMNHNSLGRGYETFGNATAETVTPRPRRLGRHPWSGTGPGRPARRSAGRCATT